MKRFSLYILISWFALTASTLPESDSPGKNNALLFKIERSKDPDEVWYAMNISPGGLINMNQPLRVYWVKHSEDGREEPLTRIQEKFSYGIKFIDSEKANNSWSFQLAAYPDRVFKVRSTEEGTYRSYIQSGNKEIEVTKMFVKFEGGSFLAPTIAYVNLFGKDTKTGEEVIENLKTGKNK